MNKEKRDREALRFQRAVENSDVGEKALAAARTRWLNVRDQYEEELAMAISEHREGKSVEEVASERKVAPEDVRRRLR